MSTYWPDEAEEQKKRDAAKRADCQHDFQSYTGKRRVWSLGALFMRPDEICVKCGQISFFPD